MPRTREPRKWRWPNGANIAVTVGLALEDFQYVLGATILDYFLDEGDDLLERTEASSPAAVGDVVYALLLPDDQQPPIELNQAEMEKYRPLMERHYITEPPRSAA